MRVQQKRVRNKAKPNPNSRRARRRKATKTSHHTKHMVRDLGSQASLIFPPIRSEAKPNKEMASRIKTARGWKKLTQKRLAELLGLTPGAVGQWEITKTAPTTDNLNRLASALNVTADWLLNGTPDIGSSKC